MSPGVNWGFHEESHPQSAVLRTGYHKGETGQGLFLRYVLLT